MRSDVSLRAASHTSRAASSVVHRGNYEAPPQHRARPKARGPSRARPHDPHIRRRIVAGRQERSPRQAAATMPVPGQDQRAGQVHRQRPQPQHRQRHSSGGTGACSFCHSVHRKAAAGSSMMTASPMASRARAATVQPSPIRISVLIPGVFQKIHAVGEQARRCRWPAPPRTRCRSSQGSAPRTSRSAPRRVTPAARAGKQHQRQAATDPDTEGGRNHKQHQPVPPLAKPRPAPRPSAQPRQSSGPGQPGGRGVHVPGVDQSRQPVRVTCMYRRRTSTSDAPPPRPPAPARRCAGVHGFVHPRCPSGRPR